MESRERYSFGRTRNHLALFIALLFLSMAFFVSAQDDLSGKNIFDDPDQDGLSTEEEKLYKTDPNIKDTDGDGYSDGVEVKGGYDPTKPAPGDKIVPEKKANSTETQGYGVGGDNLTEQMSEEIAMLIQNAQSDDEATEISEISIEDLNSLIQKTASGEFNEISLPEIDKDSIKVKKQSFGKISDEKKQAKIKEDILEYLTVLAYVFANNSPEGINMNDAQDIRSFAEQTLNESIFSLSSGEMKYFDTFVKSSDRILEEIKGIEVPPQMVDVHTKALQLALYAKTLKGELDVVNPNNDPMKMISSLSKVEGLLATTISFMDEIDSKLSQYGISESDISLDF